MKKSFPLLPNPHPFSRKAEYLALRCRAARRNKNCLAPAGRRPGDKRPRQRQRSVIAKPGGFCDEYDVGVDSSSSTTSAQEQGALRRSKHTAVRRNHQLPCLSCRRRDKRHHSQRQRSVPHKKQKLPCACRAVARHRRPTDKERYRAAIREFFQGGAEGVDFSSSTEATSAGKARGSKRERSAVTRSWDECVRSG